MQYKSFNITDKKFALQVTEMETENFVCDASDLNWQVGAAYNEIFVEDTSGSNEHQTFYLVERDECADYYRDGASDTTLTVFND